MNSAPTLSSGPRVRPRVVKTDLSPKSGSVPTQEMTGLFQNEANSATGFKAGIINPGIIVQFYLYGPHTRYGGM